jgi:hypothetical protein
MILHIDDLLSHLNSTRGAAMDTIHTDQKTLPNLPQSILPSGGSICPEKRLRINDVVLYGISEINVFELHRYLAK